jgi:hypothetical protein
LQEKTHDLLTESKFASAKRSHKEKFLKREALGITHRFMKLVPDARLKIKTRLEIQFAEKIWGRGEDAMRKITLSRRKGEGGIERGIGHG